MFTFSPSLPDPGSRTAMLKSVQRNIGKEPVPRELLAFCYLCPLDAPAVTKLCKLSKEDLIHWGKKCREAAEEWCLSSWNSEVNVQSDSNPTDFSTQAKSRQISCAITKTPIETCPAARILRLALCQKTPDCSFWEVLEMFWCKQRKDRILNLVSNIPRNKSFPSKSSINSICNFILLSLDAQPCSRIRGDFILEPVDHDAIFNSCELDARVQWILRHSSHPQNTRINTDPAICELPQNNHDIKLYNHGTNLPIKDVDITSFKTDYPISMPLLDRDLLDLRGFMMQVLRLAGRTPSDGNEGNCALSVADDIVGERSGRLAERDRGLGYILEAELEDDVAASGYPGSGISSFPLNPPAGSIEDEESRESKGVLTTRAIWFRMRSFLRTCRLRDRQGEGC